MTRIYRVFDIDSRWVAEIMPIGAGKKAQNRENVGVLKREMSANGYDFYESRAGIFGVPVSITVYGERDPAVDFFSAAGRFGLKFVERGALKREAALPSHDHYLAEHEPLALV